MEVAREERMRNREELDGVQEDLGKCGNSFESYVYFSKNAILLQLKVTKNCSNLPKKRKNFWPKKSPSRRKLKSSERSLRRPTRKQTR